MSPAEACGVTGGGVRCHRRRHGTNPVRVVARHDVEEGAWRRPTGAGRHGRDRLGAIGGRRNGAVPPGPSPDLPPPAGRRSSAPGPGALPTAGGGDDEQTASDATDPATSGEPEMPEAVTTEGPCAYIEAEQPPVDGLPEVGMPEDPDPTPSEGTVSVTLGTNEGEIPLTLDREQAPCTVQSFLHLAESGYFDASPCHRLVDSTDALEVLQCGDPSGTGMGGPGYNVPDEIDPEQTYPRGTLAMANSGAPNSGGSQFFMVYGDSNALGPQYTVFGSIDEGGLEVVDEIAAAGHDGSMEAQAGGGAPNTEVTIETVTIAS